MDGEKLKKQIPLGLIVGGLVYTSIDVLTSDTVLTQRHWIAYGLTSVVLLTNFINSKMSKFTLGLTLVLGLLNVIQFTPTTMTIGGGLAFLGSEFNISIQLFSLLVSGLFVYFHRQPIINWFNTDGL